MKKVFLTSLPSGIPGAISSLHSATVDPIALNTAAPFSAYGLPGKTVAGKFVPVTAANDVVTGFLVRPYPIEQAIAEQKIGDRMQRGRMTVKVNAGTPAKDSAVYVRVAAAAAGKPIGGIEAVADAANTQVIPNAVFTGPKDADGNAEIAYKI